MLTAACLAWLNCASAQSVPAAAPSTPRFDILEFVVEGDTLLGAAVIERTVYGFLGPGRTVADAEGARKALEQAYQDAGFLSVSVVLPPQRVDVGGGEVRLQVLEGRVEKLRVTGAQWHLPSLLRESLPSVAPGSVPNFNEMQQELALAARASADRDVTPLLAAGDQPGTLAVELKVQDRLPLHGSLEVDNRQSLNTRAGRASAQLSYDNLFQRGHSFALNWLVSPREPNETNIQSMNYQWPLGGPGDRLILGLVNSNSDTPTPLGGATVSRGQTWNLRWRDELPTRTGITHALTWGATYRHLRDRNRAVAGFDTEASPLRYSSFNVSYELQIERGTAGRSTAVQLDLNAGLRGLNHRTVDCGDAPRDQFECKRASASSGFQVWSLSFTHREPIGRWQLLARLQGQFSDAPLVPSEQVVYGGQDSVRGYYEGEQAGDLGAALRLELNTPAWAPTERVSVTGLVFHDRAIVRRLYALAEEQDQAQLASAGLGLRLDTAFGLQATLAWARVLQNTSRSVGNGFFEPVSGSSANRAQRWDLRVRQSF